MLEVSHTTDEVLGVSRDLPLNYIDRREVDDKFVESLSRGQHIVIYGSSKQGKTSLRKHCLNNDDYVVVSCQNRWNLADLHSSILKSCGFEVKLSAERSVSGGHKILAEASGKAGIPFLGEAAGKGSYEYQKETDRTIETQPLELDPEDPNEVVRALKEIDFRKFIVLEDFHYLPDETQRDFSFSLKTMHENSKLSFIVVGVWREEIG